MDSNPKGILHTTLYNPLTRASKILPDPYNSFDGCHFSFVYGFVHGANLDDLKIVWIRARNSSNYHLNTCDVFNFKTNSWSTPIIVTQLYSKYEF